MNWTESYQRLNMERTAATALVHMASDTSSIIRIRLADVARDLRKAALKAGLDGAQLLEIAKRFEQNAKSGETP